MVTKNDGSESAPLDVAKTFSNTIVEEACEGLDDVDPQKEIIEEAKKNLYNGVNLLLTCKVLALVMTARTLVEKEPNYSFVTARILAGSTSELKPWSLLEYRRNDATQTEICKNTLP